MRIQAIGATLSLCVLFAVGCNAPVDESGAEPADDLTAETAAPRFQGKEGKLFARALELEGLSAEQRTTIEGLADGIREEAPSKSGFRSALADGIRAGAIDDAAVAREMDAMAKAREAHRARVASAIQSLHGVLSVAQREALVDSLASGGHAGCGGDKSDKSARKGDLFTLAKGLDLSDAQRDELHAVKEALWAGKRDRAGKKAMKEGRRAHLRELGEAFVSADFDAAAATSAMMAPKGRDRLEGKVAFAKALARILTPAQRAELADRMMADRMVAPMRGEG
jgi:Spy/CpxP family protein refolding chaperone